MANGAADDITTEATKKDKKEAMKMKTGESEQETKQILQSHKSIQPLIL